MISLLLIIFGSIIFVLLLFQLSQFLESLTSKLTSEGDLDGILLTGIELLYPHFITEVQIIRPQLLSKFNIDKMPESKVKVGQLLSQHSWKLVTANIKYYPGEQSDSLMSLWFMNASENIIWNLRCQTY